MMNAEAARLGMRDTHFINPNGWHHPDQQTSARDLAILAMALMREFPGLFRLLEHRRRSSSASRCCNNTNGLVGRYSGIGGMKTGFVCASGFNVVATATRGGRTLIAVVLGALSGSERTVKAAQLLDDGFGKWGGFGYTVATLPSERRPRPEHLRRCPPQGRRRALADDVDVAGPIRRAARPAARRQCRWHQRPLRRPSRRSRAQPAAVLSRAPSGRIVLGPARPADPDPGRLRPHAGVGLGAAGGQCHRHRRQPGRARRAPDHRAGRRRSRPACSASPRRARRSGNGAIPGGDHRLCARDDVADAAARRLRPGPLRLQGAIQPGAATPTSLRPGAAAGIRPAPAPAGPADAAEVRRPPRLPLPRHPPASPQPARRPAASRPVARPTEAKARPKAKPKAKPDDA